MSGSARVDSFHVHPDDVHPLCEGLLHARFVGLSPLLGITGASPTPRASADALRALAATPALQGTVAIVADPDLRVDVVIGGGSVAPAHVALVRRREVDAARVVGVSRAPGGGWLLHRFEDATAASRWLARLSSRIPEFVAWDADTMAEVAATVDQPRQIPAELPLEAVIYLFHAIDLFRRVTYEHLLAYAPVDGPVQVAADTFRAELPRALRSGDIRWLLPAFHRLMPDLAQHDVAPRPEHLALLDAAGILHGARGPDGEAQLVFGEVGTRLGIEFYRTWHAAAAVALHRRGEPDRAGHRWFLAPTAFANHLFALRASGRGHATVHHEALDEEGLVRAIQALVDAPPVP